MKEKLNKIKQNLKDGLMSLFFLAFLFSGWAMYLNTTINREEKETKALKTKTSEIKDSINASIRDPESKFIVTGDLLNSIDEIIEMTNNLIKENAELQDSLTYYSMFYDIVNENHNFKYDFAVSDSANVRRYFVTLTETIKEPVREKKIDLHKQDSINNKENVLVNDNITPSVNDSLTPSSEDKDTIR